MKVWTVRYCRPDVSCISAFLHTYTTTPSITPIAFLGTRDSRTFIQCIARAGSLRPLRSLIRRLPHGIRSPVNSREESSLASYPSLHRVRRGHEVLVGIVTPRCVLYTNS